ISRVHSLTQYGLCYLTVCEFSLLILFFFFFQCHGHPRDLHSFPTRRSSDLRDRGGVPDRPRIDPDACRGRGRGGHQGAHHPGGQDRKSTRLNSSHVSISYAVFCLKKKKNEIKKATRYIINDKEQ